MTEAVEDDGVEVGHDEEAESDGDDADKFDAVVRVDAVGEIFCDLAVENDAGAAAGEDDKAYEEGAEIE